MKYIILSLIVLLIGGTVSALFVSNRVQNDSEEIEKFNKVHLMMSRTEMLGLYLNLQECDISMADRGAWISDTKKFSPEDIKKIKSVYRIAVDRVMVDYAAYFVFDDTGHLIGKREYK